MKKIIIADDHSLVREGIKRVLTESFPFAQIDDVSDGVELVKKVTKEHYDLVISDVTMPNMSGIEALKIIKEQSPSTLVLIMSMHPVEQYAVRAIKNGASGYLTKESAITELVSAVDKILSGKKYITPELADLLANSIRDDTENASYQSLSDREFEVFKLIAEGKSTSEISELLFLNKNTISTYKSRIFEKLNLHSNAEIIKYAIANNLI
ncbi:response regulator [Limnovirga soli]|jgi:two-component system, NarL family, invasion response regulator UvrY|uniref:Response regulator n=1 Tax=Limnovirga soli TaxID=2656915 RepID=A0A8J8JW56_9BACT|nr:response regulator transcription factor [Limnovirga soli]NNV54966.1 response regulator [Limnovirga soli]